MYCASDNKTLPEVSSSQSSRNVKDGKFACHNTNLTVSTKTLTISSIGEALTLGTSIFFCINRFKTTNDSLQKFYCSFQVHVLITGITVFFYK